MYLAWGPTLIWIFSYENSIRGIVVTLCDFSLKSTIHSSMISKNVLPEFEIFISLRRYPPQVRVTSAQKLCTKIIYIVLQTVPSSQKKSFPLKQHQMSKINFKVYMKVLSKLLLKWNWWWNFTCVCTISLNFDIYFVEFTWEIVFCVVSDNCFRKCKKDSV